jgi:putative transcriptional regulator
MSNPFAPPFMRDEKFEWDDEKANANIRDHGVSFPQAAFAFADAFAVEWTDEREAYGEERSVLLGMIRGQLLTLCTATVSGLSRRGEPRDMSKTSTIARMRPDGVLVRINPDGTEEAIPVEPLAPMTPGEVEAGAWRGLDARPFTPEELSKARRIPRTKTLRRALGLTQEEFSARYHIPLDTLQNWEQGRSEPDDPARAYLTLIANDPEGVRRALEPRRG